MSEANVNDSLFLLTQLKENASERTSTLKVKLVPKCSQYLLPSAVQNKAAKNRQMQRRDLIRLVTEHLHRVQRG